MCSPQIPMKSHCDHKKIPQPRRLNKPAEQIAKRVDRLMRHEQRDMSDAAFEVLLVATLALTICHRALAKRLLLERNASDDFENAMAQKLTEKTLRHGFTMQRLAVPCVNERRGLAFFDLNNYTTSYKIKHEGHKLSLGTTTVQAQFAAGPKDLTVSLYQAVTLLLFNGLGTTCRSQELSPNTSQARTLLRQACFDTRESSWPMLCQLGHTLGVMERTLINSFKQEATMSGM
ncbi:hypothetical protein BDR05DRAFT_1015896 [Suillus weaverae]|nr:hypothetical protein BDR05DRAFT_1015896 [Suillus weaverae]